MRRLGGSLLVVCALAGSARADVFTIADGLRIALPDGLFTQQSTDKIKQMLVLPGNAGQAQAFRSEHSCAAVFAEFMAREQHTLEPAHGPSARWYSQRGVDAESVAYCRDLDDGGAVIFEAGADGDVLTDQLADLLASAIDLGAEAQRTGGALPIPPRVALLPGAPLLVFPPDGWTVDADALTSPSGAVHAVGATLEASCEVAVPGEATGRSHEAPAVGAAGRWYPRRVVTDDKPGESVYCRDLGGHRALVLLVTTTGGDAALTGEGAALLERVDLMLSPPRPVRVSVAGLPHAVELDGGRYYRDAQQQLRLEPDLPVTIASGAGDCIEWSVEHGAGAGWQQEPDKTVPASFEPNRARGHGKLAYCMTLMSSTASRLDVEIGEAMLRDHPGDVADLLIAIDVAGGGSGQSMADISASVGHGGGASGPVESHVEDEAPRPPAPFTALRVGVFAGQESASATAPGDGTDHPAGGVRASLAPRYMSDYDDSGWSFGGHVALGGDGPAFAFDAQMVAGFAVGETSQVGVYALFGGDRVGGGFDPEAGMYVGGAAFLRAAFGTASLEAEGEAIAGTGVAELRAEVGVTGHVGSRLVAVSGLWQSWVDHGGMLGAALSITP